MQISNFDKRMLSLARDEAAKSCDEHFHLGCVITYKRKVISVGRNKDKTHPLQGRYNKYRNFNNSEHMYIKHSIHAEIDAISSIPYLIGKEIDKENGWDKVSLYVCRYSTNKSIACSRPCKACMNAIINLGIKNVYYTEDFGIGYINIIEHKEMDLS